MFINTCARFVARNLRGKLKLSPKYCLLVKLFDFMPQYLSCQTRFTLFNVINKRKGGKRFRDYKTEFISVVYVFGNLANTVDSCQ